MDLAAIIISVVSALLALGSFIVSYMTYKRDVPQLTIRPVFTTGLREPATLGIDVTNTGKRPTTLMEVGFRVEADFKINISKIGEKKPYANNVPVTKNIMLSEVPIMLTPGEVKKFRMVINKWPDVMVHADYPLRPFATGSHGGTCWGHSRPSLREMLNTGWKAPVSTPEALIKPLPTKPKPMPIYPKWKLWKPKYLR